jgi:hypothetical protein
MDPDQCLNELLELKEKLKSRLDGYECWTDLAEAAPAEEVDQFISDANELVNHIDALDKWMKKGGFPPKRWAQLGARDTCPD